MIPVSELKEGDYFWFNSGHLCKCIIYEGELRCNTVKSLRLGNPDALFIIDNSDLFSVKKIAKIKHKTQNEPQS